jgi:biotin operon repressor
MTPLQEKILAILAAASGEYIDRRELAKEAGVSLPTIAWNVQMLVIRHGQVIESKYGLGLRLAVTE